MLAVADEREVLRIAQRLLHAGKKEHDNKSRSVKVKVDRNSKSTVVICRPGPAVPLHTEE